MVGLTVVEKRVAAQKVGLKVQPPAVWIVVILFRDVEGEFCAELWREDFSMLE